jgi:hypothetical protein
MRVYQQVLDMGGAPVEQLEGVLGRTIQEAFATYSGREGLDTQWAPGPEIVSRGYADCLDIPANSRVHRPDSSRRRSPSFTARSRGFGD